MITGILGFVAYMSLFLSIFFFSLSWLGLMRTRGQKILFFVLAIGGALAGSLLAYAAMGNWVLFGIALPAGMSLGILAYILVAAIWNEVAHHPMRLGQRELIIMTILATVIGHFIEIHFGIAIASTRTYFWIWSAVLVVVGMGWLKLSEEAEQPAPQPVPAATSSRKKGRRSATAPARPAASSGSQWDEVIIYSVVLGIMLFIIAFNYIINPNVLDLRSSNPIVVFIQAFTSRVDTKLGERFVSLGLFWMVTFVVLVGTVVALLDIARSRATAVTGRWLGKGALVSLAISLGMFFGLGLLHAATIARDAARQQPGSSITLEQLANMSASHVTEFYAISLLLLLLLGFTIWRAHRGGPGWLGAGRWLAPVVGAVLAVVGLLVIFNLNASLVRADIIYKQGQAYDNARRYTEAIQLYQMAIDEEPQEDYYYLFLGRAQLEQGRASTGAQQTGFLANAEESLLRAQALNPLNTDHSANLGRLYLAWSQMSSGQQRADSVQRALDYYSVATGLSPTRLICTTNTVPRTRSPASLTRQRNSSKSRWRWTRNMPTPIGGWATSISAATRTTRPSKPTRRVWSSRHAIRHSTATWASSTPSKATRTKPSSTTWPCWKRVPMIWRRSAIWRFFTARLATTTARSCSPSARWSWSPRMRIGPRCRA